MVVIRAGYQTGFDAAGFDADRLHEFGQFEPKGLVLVAVLKAITEVAR